MTEVSSDKFLAEVTFRAEKMFVEYEQGRDVATGDRLRLEGFMQAGLALEIVSFTQVHNALNTAHQKAFGLPFGEVFPPYDPLLCIIAIPALMQRAPVYPTTKD